MIRSDRKHLIGRGAPCTAGRNYRAMRPACPIRPRLTEGQLAAIRAVMWLFVEDDLANGVAADALRPCAGCRQEQPVAGFIRYGDRTVCNACATAYEISRTSGEVSNIEGFLRRG